MALDTFLIGFGYEDTPGEILVFILYMSLFHFINYQLTNSPVILNGDKWKVFIGFVVVGILITFSLEPQLDYMLYVRYLLTDILIAYIGLEVYMTHWNLDIPHPTLKVKGGRIAWILLGLMASLLGVVRSITFSYLTWDALYRDANVSIENSLIMDTSLFVTFSYAIVGLIMLVIVFFVPESLIASKHQLLKVYDLYKLIEKEKLQKNTSDFQFHYLSVEYVKDFLDSINFDEFPLN